MAQKYKLRLSEGTLLVVDHDGLSTWLVDDRAMVQPLGAQGWRPLKRFLAEERAGGASWPLPDEVRPARRPAREPKNENKGMLGVLSGWVDAISAKSGAKSETAAPGLSEPLRSLAQELAAPPPPPVYTAAPASAPDSLAAEPIPFEVDDAAPSFDPSPVEEPSPMFEPSQMVEPSQMLREAVVEPPVSAPLRPSAAAPVNAGPTLLDLVDESVEVHEVAEIPVEPPPRDPNADDDDMPTIPRIELEDIYAKPGTRPRATPPPKPATPKPVAAKPAAKPAARPPAAKAPSPLAARVIGPDDDMPTVPRMQLDELDAPAAAFGARPRAQVLADELAAIAAEQSAPPSRKWKPADEDLPALPRRRQEVHEPTPMFGSRAQVQVLADEPATSWSANPRAKANEEDLPVLAFKPMTEDDTSARGTMHEDDEPLGFLEALAQPPPPSITERALDTVSEWAVLLKGWSDSVLSPAPRLPAAPPPEPRSVFAETATPAAPQGPGLLARLQDTAAAGLTHARGVVSVWPSVIGAWFESVMPRRSSTTSSAPLSLSLSSPSSERVASYEPEDLFSPPVAAQTPFREPFPSPPPPPAVKPPPAVHELPVLRLAELPVESRRVEEDVYDEDYDGPGIFDAIWFFVRRVVVSAALVGGTIAAAATWETWLPKAGLFGIAVFGEIEKHTQPPKAEEPSADEKERQQREQALRDASDQLPHLAPETIELVMASGLGSVLDPPEVFRRAYDAAERGLPALTPEEAAELDALTKEMIAGLPPAERDRAREYERLRMKRATLPFEDRDMAALLSRAARAMSPESRERLRVLSGKAVAAGLGVVPPANPNA